MNYIVIIMVVALLFGVTDFFTERYPRLQRDIYYIALCTITFLFTIKYYYGPDMIHYVPFYEDVPSIHEILHPADATKGYEPAFMLFCRILSDCGVSFYWMTAIVSLFYFASIALLFRNIERNRAFALAILVILDYRCIFSTYRQCLAVSFFILMVLCLQNRKYLWMALMAFLTIAFHKSGAFVVSAVLLLYIVRSKWIKPYLYQLLLAVLIMIVLIPTAQISSAFLSHLPLPENYIDSLEHHLSLGRQIQMVFLVYAATLLCAVHFTQYRYTRFQAIAATALIGLVLIVMLYQYYYLLERMRSYFLPIVIAFIFQMMQQSENEKVSIPYSTLLKQLSCVLIVAYLSHYILFFYNGTKKLKYNVYATCTVFDLRHHTAKELRDHQVRLSQQYWWYDFMSTNDNKLK